MSESPTAAEFPESGANTDTSSARGPERAPGRRGLSAITVVAIALVWFPFLNIVLAHIAEHGAEGRGTVDGRVAFRTTIVAWAVTVLVVVWYASLFSQVDPGPERRRRGDHLWASGYSSEHGQ